MLLGFKNYGSENLIVGGIILSLSVMAVVPLKGKPC